MKKRNTAKQQKGFFDLGFSLAILALFGAFAYAVTPDQDARVAVQQPQIEVVANYQEGERR
ncbi:MAG: hypothetical protein OES20_11660 [Gammaproteobacteria bacterium]|nr:hypothetical protein [Gammaproteobacteria bacterium]MDH3857127.1 hypothetical protein [Gammaproteobacteria bacterium]